MREILEKKYMHKLVLHIYIEEQEEVAVVVVDVVDINGGPYTHSYIDDWVVLSWGIFLTLLTTNLCVHRIMCLESN